MKQVLLFCVLIFSILSAYGQGGKGGASTGSAAPSGLILYNNKQSKSNPNFAAFPVDRAFTLEIDSIPTNHISKVFVYPIESRPDPGDPNSRHRVLFDPDHKKTKNFRPSFEIGGQDTSIGINIIQLRFPALKAGKKFDISIVKQFSPINLAKALNLNKAIDSLDFTKWATPPTWDKQTDYKNKVDALLKDLLTSVNGNSQYHELQLNYLVEMEHGKELKDNNHTIEINDVKTYQKYFYDPLVKYYKTLISTAPKMDPAITDTAIFWAHKYFNHEEIEGIINSTLARSPIYNRLYILQQIFDEQAFNAVLTGNKRIDFTLLNPATDTYDFNTRVKNINIAYKFLDSLNNTLIILNEKEVIDYSSLITTTKLYLADLKHNRDLITKYSTVITNQTLLNSTENIWVIGQSTASPDLQTLSSRLFAVNAGFTTIYAKDNSGKFACIPKFFLGIDYRFTPTDKNADFTDALPIGKVSDTRSHLLEARQGFWSRWSVTAGVTFGPMTNKDFNNTYGSFSFTLGPSYTFCKYLKISAGAALIHRYDNNPVLSSTDKPLVCPYVSLSVDYDLLTVVQGITGSLFK